MSKNYGPQITIDGRGCQVHVLSIGQAVPPAFANLVTVDRGEGIQAAREVVRIAGGCKHISPEIVSAMPGYFREAFRTVDEDGNTVTEFRGTAFSGGTANLDGDGVVNDGMVTNMPAVLANAYPCIAMSTTPRTDIMALDGQTGGLIVDAYGGRIDFRQHAAMVVQQDPAEVLDWDGDLDIYLTLLEGWQMAGFKTAIIAMNGGGVTRDEIYGALKRGIPVIAVEGSLRETDAFIKAWRDGDWSATDEGVRENCQAVVDAADKSLVKVVTINKPEELRAALVELGFLS